MFNPILKKYPNNPILIRDDHKKTMMYKMFLEENKKIS